MAEQLLMQHNVKQIPIAIIRPSVVGPSIEEPMIGWTDTLGLLSGCTMLVGLGILKDLPGDYSIISDIVPVDHVVKQLLV
jgi:hypothetical protein